MADRRRGDKPAGSGLRPPEADQAIEAALLIWRGKRARGEAKLEELQRDSPSAASCLALCKLRIEDAVNVVLKEDVDDAERDARVLDKLAAAFDAGVTGLTEHHSSNAVVCLLYLFWVTAGRLDCEQRVQFQQRLKACLMQFGGRFPPEDWWARPEWEDLKCNRFGWECTTANVDLAKRHHHTRLLIQALKGVGGDVRADDEPVWQRLHDYEFLPVEWRAALEQRVRQLREEEGERASAQRAQWQQPKPSREGGVPDRRLKPVRRKEAEWEEQQLKRKQWRAPHEKANAQADRIQSYLARRLAGLPPEQQPAALCQATRVPLPDVLTQLAQLEAEGKVPAPRAALVRECLQAADSESAALCFRWPGPVPTGDDGGEDAARWLPQHEGEEGAQQDARAAARAVERGTVDALAFARALSDLARAPAALQQLVVELSATAMHPLPMVLNALQPLPTSKEIAELMQESSLELPGVEELEVVATQKDVAATAALPLAGGDCSLGMLADASASVATGDVNSNSSDSEDWELGRTSEDLRGVKERRVEEAIAQEGRDEGITFRNSFVSLLFCKFRKMRHVLESVAWAAPPASPKLQRALIEQRRAQPALMEQQRVHAGRECLHWLLLGWQMLVAVQQERRGAGVGPAMLQQMQLAAQEQWGAELLLPAFWPTLDGTTRQRIEGIVAECLINAETGEGFDPVCEGASILLALLALPAPAASSSTAAAAEAQAEAATAQKRALAEAVLGGLAHLQRRGRMVSTLKIAVESVCRDHTLQRINLFGESGPSITEQLEEIARQRAATVVHRLGHLPIRKLAELAALLAMVYASTCFAGAHDLLAPDSTFQTGTCGSASLAELVPAANGDALDLMVTGGGLEHIAALTAGVQPPPQQQQPDAAQARGCTNGIGGTASVRASGGSVHLAPAVRAGLEPLVHYCCGLTEAAAEERQAEPASSFQVEAGAHAAAADQMQAVRRLLLLLRLLAKELAAGREAARHADAWSCLTRHLTGVQQAVEGSDVGGLELCDDIARELAEVLTGIYSGYKRARLADDAAEVAMDCLGAHSALCAADRAARSDALNRQALAALVQYDALHKQAELQLARVAALWRRTLEAADADAQHLAEGLKTVAASLTAHSTSSGRAALQACLRAGGQRVLDNAVAVLRNAGEVQRRREELFTVTFCLLQKMLGELQYGPCARPVLNEPAELLMRHLLPPRWEAEVEAQQEQEEEAAAAAAAALLEGEEKAREEQAAAEAAKRERKRRAKAVAKARQEEAKSLGAVKTEQEEGAARPEQEVAALEVVPAEVGAAALGGAPRSAAEAAAEEVAALVQAARAAQQAKGYARMQQEWEENTRAERERERRERKQEKKQARRLAKQQQQEQGDQPLQGHAADEAVAPSPTGGAAAAGAGGSAGLGAAAQAVGEWPARTDLDSGSEAEVFLSAQTSPVAPAPTPAAPRAGAPAAAIQPVRTAAAAGAQAAEEHDAEFERLKEECLQEQVQEELQQKVQEERWEEVPGSRHRRGKGAPPSAPPQNQQASGQSAPRQAPPPSLPTPQPAAAPPSSARQAPPAVVLPPMTRAAAARQTSSHQADPQQVPVAAPAAAPQRWAHQPQPPSPLAAPQDRSERWGQRRREDIRFVSWDGDWLCHCGVVNPLKSRCQNPQCRQGQPCRDWFWGKCAKRSLCRNGGVHLPFDLPRAPPALLPGSAVFLAKPRPDARYQGPSYHRQQRVAHGRGVRLDSSPTQRASAPRLRSGSDSAQAPGLAGPGKDAASAAVAAPGASSSSADGAGAGGSWAAMARAAAAGAPPLASAGVPAADAANNSTTQQQQQQPDATTSWGIELGSDIGGGAISHAAEQAKPAMPPLSPHALGSPWAGVAGPAAFCGSWDLPADSSASTDALAHSAGGWGWGAPAGVPGPPGGAGAAAPPYSFQQQQQQQVDEKLEDQGELGDLLARMGVSTVSTGELGGAFHQQQPLAQGPWAAVPAGPVGAAEAAAVPLGTAAWPGLGEELPPPTQLPAPTGDEDEFDEELQAALQASLAEHQAEAEQSQYLAALTAAPAVGAPAELPAELEGLAGLSNAAGEYNCFLNVIIQCLWSCVEFRQAVASWPREACATDDVVAALHHLFSQFAAQQAARRQAGADAAKRGSSTQRTVLNPTQLREALAALPNAQFQVGEMSDAGEVLLTLYERIHGMSQEAADQVDACFGLRVREAVNCGQCGRTTQQNEYTQFFFNTQATSLRVMSRLLGEGGSLSLGGLLRQIESQHQKSCDTDVGGCGALNPITHVLQGEPPRMFTVQLAWETNQVAPADIAATMQQVQEALDVGELYRGVEPGAHTYRLRAMACYYGAHYMAFVFAPDLGQWLLFDDAAVSRIGAWPDVVRKCEAGRIQPCVLFYAADR